jgi:hypothetical protein
VLLGGGAVLQGLLPLLAMRAVLAHALWVLLCVWRGLTEDGVQSVDLGVGGAQLLLVVRNCRYETNTVVNYVEKPINALRLHHDR